MKNGLTENICATTKINFTNICVFRKAHTGLFMKEKLLQTVTKECNRKFFREDKISKENRLYFKKNNDLGHYYSNHNYSEIINQKRIKTLISMFQAKNLLYLQE